MNFLLKNDITYFGLIIEENSIAHRLDRLICSITIGFLVDNSGKKPTRVSISIEVDSKHCKVGGLWKISFTLMLLISEKISSNLASHVKFSDSEFHQLPVLIENWPIVQDYLLNWGANIFMGYSCHNKNATRWEK